MALKSGKTVDRSGDRPQSEVKVTFDRNLVSIIGDEHYPQAEYLFGELAANAYDADATEVRFIYHFDEDSGVYAGYQLAVEDNGSGMDLSELNSYFTFGTRHKSQRKLSARFKRPLIGRFGLGKVAALKAARRWFLDTEKDGRRHFVDVDFDRWINDQDMEGFHVERRRQRGRNGTRIELVGVHVQNFRLDRVVRTIRRLPLDKNFKVYLNDRMVSPRAWGGIAHFPIDEQVRFKMRDGEKEGRITGDIWINDKPLPLDEGTERGKGPISLEEAIGTGKEGFAGIEVKVNGATIAREFFGRETHAHGLNHLWGYVNANWLPVVANRTDYVRDSPAGQAFYDRMRERFGQIYVDWRKQEEKRRQSRSSRTEKSSASEESHEDSGIEERKHARAEKVLLASAARIQELFDSDPTLTPFLGDAPEPRPGRPSETRIRPLYQFTAVETAGDGDSAERTSVQEFAVDEKTEKSAAINLKSKRRAKKQLRRVEAGGSIEANARGVVQAIPNIPLTVQLDSADLPSDSPYRWQRDPRGGPLLTINANFPLHKRMVSRPSSDGYRLYVAVTIALALAEKRWPVVSRQRIADYVIELAAGSVPKAK